MSAVGVMSLTDAPTLRRAFVEAACGADNAWVTASAASGSAAAGDVANAEPPIAAATRVVAVSSLVNSALIHLLLEILDRP
jgi:hypothetical protein